MTALALAALGPTAFAALAWGSIGLVLAVFAATAGAIGLFLGWRRAGA